VVKATLNTQHVCLAPSTLHPQPQSYITYIAQGIDLRNEARGGVAGIAPKLPTLGPCEKIYLLQRKVKRKRKSKKDLPAPTQGAILQKSAIL